MAIVDLVLIDILERKAEGIRRYGTPLQAFNGRDSLQDAYDEAVDLAIYLRQLIEERKSKNVPFSKKLKEDMPEKLELAKTELQEQIEYLQKRVSGGCKW